MHHKLWYADAAQAAFGENVPRVLCAGKYRPIREIAEQKVSSTRTLVSSFEASIKRFRMSNSSTARSSTGDDLNGALRSLETMVGTMKEFVTLIGGCERMCRNPYDTYLYIDNFMFSRYVEKQHVLNTLLQENFNNQCAPAILPIIGGHKVDKRTLVSHVCNNEKIRSHFLFDIAYFRACHKQNRT